MAKVKRRLKRIKKRVRGGIGQVRQRFIPRPFGAADVETYHRYFPRPTGMRSGEWTPGYLYQPWTRALLERAAPGVPLLVILRDPVAQVASSINWSRWNGAPANGIMVSRHLSEGAYAHWLRLWMDLGPDRLLILQAERCFADPAEAVRACWAHLGLDEVPLPAVERQRRNEARRSEIELSPEARKMIARHLGPDVDELAALVPDLDLSLWPATTSLL